MIFVFIKTLQGEDFPGCPVVKTLHFQCMVYRFHPQSPTYHAAKKSKMKNLQGDYKALSIPSRRRSPPVLAFIFTLCSLPDPGVCGAHCGHTCSLSPPSSSLRSPQRPGQCGRCTISPDFMTFLTPRRGQRETQMSVGRPEQKQGLIHGPFWTTLSSLFTLFLFPDS